MVSPDRTAPKGNTSPLRPLADEYDNLHHLSGELARGGQGVVFRTEDDDLAVKQPLDASGDPDKSINLRERFQNVRLLPLPPRIPISLPLAILRDEPGYVMRLLSGMEPFDAFELSGTAQRMLKNKMEKQGEQWPKWLTNIRDQKMGFRFLHYARTGSTRRRLFALSQCAAILARLHSVGLVYGDISPNNVFAGKGEFPEVWLIDADNLRFERDKGGNAVYTPHYGAPEIVQGHDQSRPRTDCWAFAVLAFQVLTLCHPFIGRKVLEYDGDEGAWDADSSAAGGEPADMDEQAYRGYLAFIDDEDDDTNQAVIGSCFPRELVVTAGLTRLFQETFGAGRTRPHRRPAMAFWALELARASDQSLTCPTCSMSYFGLTTEKCPYCGAGRPAFISAKTPRWELLIPADATERPLPHRLFQPFSYKNNNDTVCEASLDFDKRIACPVRGTRPFPPDLSINFEEAVR